MASVKAAEQPLGSMDRGGLATSTNGGLEVVEITPCHLGVSRPSPSNWPKGGQTNSIAIGVT